MRFHSFACLARRLAAGGIIAASLSIAAPASHGLLDRAVSERADNSSSTRPLVFCHFMIGIESNRQTASDYLPDMKRAQAIGIDAFALNIGVDPYTEQQLDLAYAAAETAGMNVFISFDFNWFHAASDASRVGALIARYGSKKAQLMVDGKVFASSFAGDGFDVAAMRTAAGTPVFWAPNFHPDQTADPKEIDGALNWMAWPNNGHNKAPNGLGNVSVAAGDEAYQKWLAGKPYIAPVSPWFSTHFGPEVSYSKNWVFTSNLLWYERWNQILAMQPRFVEIVTWNDYGESHYIGPLASSHTDDGNSKWVNDMPHGGWLDMAVPFIKAYKAGEKDVAKHITADEIVYWYRPTPAAVNCDSTDTTMVHANNDTGNYFIGRPDGWESMPDSVFVVTLLTAPGTLTVTSGNGSEKTFEAPAGAKAFEVPMGIGSQKFALARDGKAVLSGTSPKDIVDKCVCGIYNFNAFVGSLPEQAPDHLPDIALQAFMSGLHDPSCKPTPSLGQGGGGGYASNATATSSIPGTAGSGETATATAALTTTAPTTAVPTYSASVAQSQTPSSSSTTSPTTGDVSTGTPTVESAGPTSTSSTGVPPPPQTSVAPGSSSGSGSGSGGTEQLCIKGTNAPGMSGNYMGLCDFACQYGYCPPGPCTCTQLGTPPPAPAEVQVHVKGCPLVGEDDSYLGLCAFACPRGYCPPTACRNSC